MTAPILIFAIGNESRGDDALAPLLARKIEQWLPTAGIPAAEMELIEAYQLQIEDTLDMAQRQLIIFMDAGIDTPAPFAFVRTEVSKTPNLFSHALTPGTLLALYHQMNQTDAPPSFTLCLRGEEFELGAMPSAKAEYNLNQAFIFMQNLLQNRNESAWEAYITGGNALSNEEEEEGISLSIA